MSDLPLTIVEAAAALRARTLSSVELTRAVLERADDLDEQLGVYVHRTPDSALTAAQRADDDFATGVDRGPLQGIPIGVKDIFATTDGPTTAQSLVLDPSWGGADDAFVVQRLRAAGAVITGKTTTLEFAIGLPDPEKPFPIPRNPWDRTRWAGGSSSGSASGVQAGLFLGGLGTDTGGSIRYPSALCGLTGIKPTYGRVSKATCVPLAWSMDHVGPIARSAHDCALMLQALAGHDPNDPSSVDAPVPDYVAGLDGSVRGLRIGVEREHHIRAPGVDPSISERFESALRHLAEAGAELVDVSIPRFADLNSAALVTLFAEAFTYHRPNLARRWLDYGQYTHVLLAIGGLFDASDYVQAQRLRRFGRQELSSIFGSVDVIATIPVGTGAPFVDGLDIAKLFEMPIFMAVWNLLGLPALSLPIGSTTEGLPAAMQLIGRPFDEPTVLRVADAFQRATDWHLDVPAQDHAPISDAGQDSGPSQRRTVPPNSA